MKIYPLTSKGAPKNQLRRVFDEEEAKEFLIEEQVGIDDEDKLYIFTHGEWIREPIMFLHMGRKMAVPKGINLLVFKVEKNRVTWDTDLWIDFNKRKPQKGQRCLTWIGNDFIGVEVGVYAGNGQFDYGDSFSRYEGTVTHWMPEPIKSNTNTP